MSIAELMLKAFRNFLMDRANGTLPEEPNQPAESHPPTPFLFEDEIAEILRSEGTQDIHIGDSYWNADGYSRSALIETIYDALEAGRMVTVNGRNILEL